ncbi:MAG: acetyl-CoA carboxylase biotin carboxyl carrier protein [Opitutales bacterium]|nr:acetyl-CoA carboxylase biotin carboxyl carrier protein [Opitutales bacterium]
MNIGEIRRLVEIIKANDLVEFELDEGDFSIRIRRQSDEALSVAPVASQVVPVVAPTPSQSVAAAPQSAPVEAAPVAKDVDAEEILSPMVGTFYRSPSPDSKPFVTEGDSVSPDNVVCIIEAMKVMNEIQAEKAGVVAEILVQDGEAVEFGQPLIRLKKA